MNLQVFEARGISTNRMAGDVRQCSLAKILGVSQDSGTENIQGYVRIA